MNLCIWLTATMPNTEVFYLQKEGFKTMKHGFNVEIAKKYGVNAAVVLHEINVLTHGWQIQFNARETYHFGEYWARLSTEDFKKLFPYMSVYAIKKAIHDLYDYGLIEIDNFNKNRLDRTLWYTVSLKGSKLINGR